VSDSQRKIRLSTAVVSFVLAALLNVWFAAANPLAETRTINLQRSEIFTASQSLKGQWHDPQIVILGSSIVTAPIVQAEALYLKTPFARHVKRTSEYAEQLLSKKLDVKPHVVSMAVSGCMVSDAYLVAKNILNQPTKPAAIIYGIAPRDVQDNTLPGIESSETFKVVARLDDLLPLLSDAERSFESKVDLVISRIAPLYNYRSDVHTYYVWRTKKVMERYLPWVIFDKYDDTLVLAPRKQGLFPEEAGGTLMAFPGMPLEHHDLGKTNEDYRNRYQPLKPKLIDVQFQYLRELLNLAAKRDVPIAVVNMPLSKTNQDLMPAGFYNAYLQRLNALCGAHQVPLLDLNNAQYTKDDLYVDGVHIKPEISQQLLGEMCSACTIHSVASRIGPRSRTPI
jgi:hypothetical protein